MKKIALFIVGVVAAFATSCTQYQEVTEFEPITLGKEEYSVEGYTDKQFNVSLMALGKVEITTDCDWMSTPREYINPGVVGQFNVSCTANNTIDERVGTITLTTTDTGHKISYSKTITVTQGRGESRIEVYANEEEKDNFISVGAKKGKAKFYVKSNTDYTVKTDEDWIALSTTSGKGNISNASVVEFDYDGHTGSISRIGTITIQSADKSISVPFRVEQEIIERVWPQNTIRKSVDFEAADMIQVAIRTNISWTATVRPNVNWLKLTTASYTVEDPFAGAKTSYLRFAVEENSSNVERKAMITVSSSEYHTLNIEVTQSALATISIGNGEIYQVRYMEGQYSAPIVSGADWVASSDASWLRIATTSGGVTTDGDLAFEVDHNDSGQQREAHISVMIKDHESTKQTMTVVQDHTNTIYYTGSEIASFDNLTFDKPYTHTYNNTLKEGRLVFDGEVTTIGVVNTNASPSWSSATSIILPSTIKTIGDYAFFNCYSLRNIELPDTVTEIGASAFRYCHGLYEIKIPNGVTSIKDYTFNYCSSLRSVQLPETLTSIGKHAFYGCSALKSMELPNGINEIPEETFRGCTALETITVPNSVKVIGAYAFYECAALREFIIPEGVTTISSGLFHGCSSLSSVTIPSSITEFENQAFDGCTSMKKIYISDIVKWCKIVFGWDSHPFCQTTLQGEIYLNNTLLTSVSTDAMGITEIKDDCFYNCGSITSLQANCGIEDRAFYNCANLKTVTLGNTQYIGEYAFANSGVESIDFGNTSYIAHYAFSSCKGLNDIEIPNVQVIYPHAFSASGVNSVTLGSAGSKNSMTIKESAFEKCWSLTDVILNNTKEVVIDKKAFYDCMYLNNITLPYNLTKIGESAFEDCKVMLKSVVINSKAVIEARAFYGCLHLNNVTLGSDVVSIGENAFNECSSSFEVQSKAVEPPIGAASMFAVPTGDATLTISVPVGSVDKYKAATFWSDYENYITDGQ